MAASNEWCSRLKKHEIFDILRENVDKVKTKNETIQSPLRRLYKESFDDRVRKILQRSSSNPVIRGGIKSDLTPKECFQLLGRVTQVFREEYVQKQNLAREEIESRVRILRDQKHQHLADLAECSRASAGLVDNVQRLIRKQEEASEKQEAIVQRMENLLKVLQMRMPKLSNAEVELLKDLKNIEQSLNTFESRISVLQKKLKFQDQTIAGLKQDRTAHSSSAEFSPSQTQSLKELIKQEGNDIADLVQSVKSLKVSVNV